MNILKAIVTLTLIATSCLATLSASYAPDQYNTNGTNVTFTASWAFFSKSDLVVTHTSALEVDTLLAEGAGVGKYTVFAANADYSSGATLTTGTVYPTGDRLTIERLVPYGQQLSINGDFIPAKPLEQQLDKLAAQTQQTQDDIGQTISFPDTDLSTITYSITNSAAVRAGQAVGFDSLGSITTLDIATSGGAFTAVDTGAGLSASGGTISGKADNTSLEFDGSGDFSIKDLGVTDAMIVGMLTSKLSGDVLKAQIEAVTAQTILGNTTLSSSPVEVPIVGEAGLLLDTDAMTEDSDLKGATQQSVKAYVDAHGVIQTAYLETTNQYTITTTTPLDNTVPLITEGDEVFSKSFTPTDSSNKVEVRVNLLMSHGTPVVALVISVFADSTCIGAGYSQQPSSGTVISNFTFQHTAGAATAITYSVRVGPTVGTGYVNRLTGDTSTLGGLMSSKLTITEYKN